MNTLLLTLGHNSSAIMLGDRGEVKWGYETERLSGVKSDSRSPTQFLGGVMTEKPDMVYVSHWNPYCDLSSMSAKHWDPSYFDGVPIRTLSPEMTHHDAHIHGALAYAKGSFPFVQGSYGLVVDGFGVFGEHFSVYDLSKREPVLLHRVHGYGTSLGLWYQYATAFMNLKMHEDEYKLLGYEVHCPLPLCERLDSDATAYAAQWVELMHTSVYKSKYDPVFSISALEQVKQKTWRHLSDVARRYDLDGVESIESRAVLSFYVQRVLEKVVLYWVDRVAAKNLLLSGGCFYNVKLNNLLLKTIEGKLCVYPLAGDQGCALGLYEADHPNWGGMNELDWGMRDLHDVGKVDGLVVVTGEEAAFTHLAAVLEDIGRVNLVRGNMEFGPRALCNTSTLALPTEQQVEFINHANCRNTVMPMAPVVTSKQYHELFEDTKRLVLSQRHMVCAMEYSEAPWADYAGITHEYHWPKHRHTGRPQVVRPDDHLMNDLLNTYGPLINTSFNFHGRPIAYDMVSIIENHMMQKKRDPDMVTVVIQND